MKTYKAILAALAVMGSASAAHADLSQHGAVGLPLNPTAQLPPENTWRVQADYVDTGTAEEELGGSTFELAEGKFYGLHAAGSLNSRWEISGGIEKFRVRDTFSFPLDFSDFDRTGFALGAKYLLSGQDNPQGIRVAAGVGYSHALYKNIHAYVVGTKNFGANGGRAPIVGHLGLRFDRFDYPEFDTLSPDPEKSNKVSVYAGAEVPITRSGGLALVGEIQSKRAKDTLYDSGTELFEAKFPYSLSVRWRQPGKGFSASVGVQRQGLPGFRDHAWFAQIGYTFGEGEGTENEGGAETMTTTTTTTTVTP
jgi:hypothetical protein